MRLRFYAFAAKFIVPISLILELILLQMIFSSLDRAYASNYIVLPGRRVSEKLLDGSQVELVLSREHAKLTPSVVAVFTSHMVLVSGVYTVKIPNGTRAILQAGYLQGCSLLYAGGVFVEPNEDKIYTTGGTWNYSLYEPRKNPWQDSQEPGFGVAFGEQRFTFTGSPGVTTYQALINAQVQDGGGYEYNDVTQLNESCAGYTAARAKATLTVFTSSGEEAFLTLWGRPFSLSS